MEEAERNVTWILAISIIMFFGSSYSYLVLGAGYPSITFMRDAWYYLSRINTLSFIATLTSSALYKAQLWKTRMYMLSVGFFIISMTLLFLQGLRAIA